MPEDSARGFESYANNGLRVHWLVNRLVRDRFSLPQRDEFLKTAMKNTSFGWLIRFSLRCLEEHQPSKEKGQKPTPKEERFVSFETAKLFASKALTQFRKFALDGTLLERYDLENLIYRWRDLSEDIEVKAWINVQLKTKKGTIKIIETITGEVVSAGLGMGGLGDNVVTRRPIVSKGSVEKILDLDGLIEKAKKLSSSKDLNLEEKEIIENFFEGLKNNDF